MPLALAGFAAFVENSTICKLGRVLAGNCNCALVHVDSTESTNDEREPAAIQGIDADRWRELESESVLPTRIGRGLLSKPANQTRAQHKHWCLRSQRTIDILTIVVNSHDRTSGCIHSNRLDHNTAGFDINGRACLCIPGVRYCEGNDVFLSRNRVGTIDLKDEHAVLLIPFAIEGVGAHINGTIVSSGTEEPRDGDEGGRGRCGQRNVGLDGDRDLVLRTGLCAALTDGLHGELRGNNQSAHLERLTFLRCSVDNTVWRRLRRVLVHRNLRNRDTTCLDAHSRRLLRAGWVANEEGEFVLSVLHNGSVGDLDSKRAVLWVPDGGVLEESTGQAHLIVFILHTSAIQA
mmetsp:Transcript_110797/g.165869  ORF Transcript_110797/g.165869 Transcript_110797/m.165869 type:complete len:348 (+) Transcript_110797:2087-3130(+)